MASSQMPLRRLSNISRAVDNIENKCATVGLSFPSLDEPYDPNGPNESLVIDPEIVQNAMLVIAAADQLASILRLPGLSVFNLAIGFNILSSLQALLKGNVVEILREGGPKGVHANDIAIQNGMDSNKVSRLLRLLATHHVFCEIEPDLWTNNRLSSFLDTKKPTQELFLHPQNKHVGTPGFAALVEHWYNALIVTSSEIIKAAASLGEVLTDPFTARSEDPTESAWNHAFNIRTTRFEWLAAPENDAIRSRFNIGMNGMSKLDDGQAMLRGFPWRSIPENSKIIDMGGGIGSASLTVSKEFPCFKFVIQDRPSLRRQSEAFWEETLPRSRKSGRFTFQGHDYFTPQPVTDADVFLLRLVTHDCSATSVITSLKHLRAVSIPGKTKLLVVDQVAPYAGPDPGHTPYTNITGYNPPQVPEPLLSNLGKASSMVYLMDIQMLTFFQGQERTLGEHIHVTSAAGWNITNVYSPSGSILRHIVAEAV